MSCVEVITGTVRLWRSSAVCDDSKGSNVPRVLGTHVLFLHSVAALLLATFWCHFVSSWRALCFSLIFVTAIVSVLSDRPSVPFRPSTYSPHRRQHDEGSRAHSQGTSIREHFTDKSPLFRCLRRVVSDSLTASFEWATVDPRVGSVLLGGSGDARVRQHGRAGSLHSRLLSFTSAISGFQHLNRDI